jgi:hypothetical protein
MATESYSELQARYEDLLRGEVCFEFRELSCDDALLDV